jgi:hypothetical protein
VIVLAADSGETVPSLVNADVIANVGAIVMSPALLELVDDEGEIGDERWIRPPKSRDRGRKVPQDAWSSTFVASLRTTSAYTVTHSGSDPCLLPG